MKQVKVRRQVKIKAQPICDLEENDIGKKITIVDINREFYTGTFKEIVDDNVILQNPGELIGLGLPLKSVICFFYGKLEDAIKKTY
ncbi:MAG: hypothetical protein IJ436_08405 [Bacteroidaceae bacterium]|nr:hypothetical protein [Bacteroidaceae bacterium]MBQ8543479.1 hypothetical protein [Bacteroidaceae bacterium]